MKALTVGPSVTDPGAKSKTVLGAVHLPSGLSVGIPCIVANGAEDGPTLVLSGATHGNEIAGTGAIIEVMRTLDPKQMRGAVIAFQSPIRWRLIKAPMSLRKMDATWHRAFTGEQIRAGL